MEAQISHPLTGSTRDHARAALARAFEEAAVMPGTLLPHEILEELTGLAGRIVAELTASAPERVPPNASEPWSYIVEHTIGTTVTGLLIGRRLLPPGSLDELGRGLFFQNIGMLALPPNLIQKPRPLEADERALMMRHPLLGLEFLRDDAVGPGARSVVRSHHERWDGSGYPSGLIGDEASQFARIAAVAEAFDAMTSERYHARAMSPDAATEIIRSGSGSEFDPAVVDAFVSVV